MPGFSDPSCRHASPSPWLDVEPTGHDTAASYHAEIFWGTADIAAWLMFLVPLDPVLVDDASMHMNCSRVGILRLHCLDFATQVVEHQPLVAKRVDALAVHVGASPADHKFMGLRHRFKQHVQDCKFRTSWPLTFSLAIEKSSVRASVSCLHIACHLMRQNRPR